MGLPVKPLLIFAEKRRATLDFIIQTPCDDVTDNKHLLSRIFIAFKILALWLWVMARELICSFRLLGNPGALLLVTKYGLRLRVSHDSSIQISYTPRLRERCLQLFKKYLRLPKKSVHDDVEESDDEPIPSAPFSYYLFPSWCTSFLWYKDCPHSPEVDEDVISDRYPRLAEFYFEWLKIYDVDEVERQESLW